MPKRDKDGNIIIKLTPDQQIWLIRFLNKEWRDEVVFRLEEGAHNTEYLKDILDVYKPLLGIPVNGLDLYLNHSDLEDKQKDIEEIEANG